VSSAGKKKRGPALMTKVLKKKKLRRARKRAPPVTLQPGQKVVVETLSTSSIADVVWQVREIFSELNYSPYAIRRHLR
jgi:ubiquitin-conjugating enzyme E2 O